MHKMSEKDKKAEEKTTKEEEASKEEDAAKEEECTATFEPVVKLEEVDVKSGEEEEEVVYSKRSKLFICGETLLDKGTGNKVWRERGVGEVKLLKHREHHRIRLLMRQEKTMKVIANHAVDPKIKLEPNAGSDRSWVWSAFDFAEGELEGTVFAIRFGDSDIANEFKEAFLKCQKEMESLTCIPHRSHTRYYLSESSDDEDGNEATKGPTDTILSLLSQFQLIRRVSRCFDYIMQTQAPWDDEGVRKHRSMLVSQLPPAQRAEFVQAFRLIDADGDGAIELIELKRVQKSIGEDKTDEELAQMIAKASRRTQWDTRPVISLEDFLGIMAEAELYHLLSDIFSALDKNDTGYVKAKEMYRVLNGVRDLIPDDRSRTIIGVEDEEMLIDYEQFSRMLLGSTLA